MLSFIKKHRSLAFLYVLLCALSAGAHTLLAFLMGDLAESALHDGASATVRAAALTVGWLLPMGLALWLRAMAAARISADYVADLRRSLITASFHLSLPADAKRVEQRKRLDQAIINDAEMIGTDYASTATVLILDAMVLASGLIGTALVSPIFVPIIVGLSLLSWLLPRLADPTLRATQKASGR